MKAQFPTEQAESGEFQRQEDVFREWITIDGSTPYAAAKDRYHLYVSLACPWASRAVIFRKLKKLESVISMSIVDAFMGENGWAFSAPDGSITPGSTSDDINGARFLYEIYLKAQPDYTGRV